MYVALYRGTRVFPSKMIQWYTRSDYSHVAWTLSDGTTYESSSIAGVRRMTNPWGGYDRSTVIDFYAPRSISQIEIDAITKFYQANLGCKYDYPGVGAFFFRTRNHQNNDKWFCSEILFSAFLDAGYPLLHPDVDPYMVNPRDISLSPFLERVESPFKNL